MDILTDEDVYFRTVKFLRQLDLNVQTVSDENLNGSNDRKLLQHAHCHYSLLATRDKDFGRLVFLRRIPTSGVMFLKMHPGTIDSVHKQINVFFEEKSLSELKDVFITVEPSGHRIRQLPE